MRCAAVSVPANIAEGAARSGTKELVRFLSIAEASLSELDTHVEIARRLGYLKNDQLHAEIDAVAALLMGLSASVKGFSRLFCTSAFTLHSFTHSLIHPSPFTPSPFTSKT